MPVNSTQRTLAQIAKLEKDDVLAKIAAAGLPATTASSNRARVNNTDAATMNSQGLAGAHELRDDPNQSFNMNAFEAYEAYVNDTLGAVEARKASGAGGATAYPDERAFPTNAPSSDPNR